MRKRYRRPHRIRKRKSIFKGRAFWVLVFILALLGSGFYFFAFSDFFRIKDVVITGQQKVVETEIESIIKEELKGSILLLNSQRIRELVLQKFPQIAELEIKKSLPNILNLALAERKEVGVFCQRNENCFLLDAEGVIFEQASKESALLRLYNQTLNKELNLGDSVFDKETLEAILKIDVALKSNLAISAKEFTLASSERLNAKTSEGWEIYFNVKKDLDWQIAALVTLLDKRIPPEKRVELKYIDLRFDKIFVYPLLSD